MRLDRLILKNFRAYKKRTVIEFSDLTTFVGRNDIGKSTILEALEIFFNSDLVKCERGDLSIHSDSNEIEISCVFSDLPHEIIIDATSKTSLTDEYLLNSEGKLEISKKFSATSNNPKETVYIVCEHPTGKGLNDLHSLTNAELKTRATSLSVSTEQFDARDNVSIRKAIWLSDESLSCTMTKLLMDKADAKKVYDSIKKYLPTYALFQTDRRSTEDDKEIVDPMKFAVKSAIAEVADQISEIKDEVQRKALETAERTLEKLREINPDLADQLIPEFKSEPSFDSAFKLTIKSGEDIPLNKRGSGVRRLVLLSFFRAEAERKTSGADNASLIYAFEEPETSQHPSHQEILLDAFRNLACSANCQVVLTTHTPELAGKIEKESLRLIEKDELGDSVISMGSDDVYQKICDSLGILPSPIPQGATALLLVEGKADVSFVCHTAQALKDAGYLESTFIDKGYAIVPIGGCGNLKHWNTMKLAQQFGLPWCVLWTLTKAH